MFFVRTRISTLSSFWPLARHCPERQTKWNGTWHVTAPIILFRRSRNRLSTQMARSGGESLRWLLMRFTLIGFLQHCLCRTETLPEIRANNVYQLYQKLLRSPFVSMGKNIQRKHIIVHYAYCRRRQRDSSCLLPRSSYDRRRLSLGSRQMAEKCVHKNDCSNRSSRCWDALWQIENTIKSLIYLVSFIFLIRFVHPNDCSCLIDSIR